MITQAFGRWTIVRKLPAGGMGRVYEAVEPATGRRVALKLIDRTPDRESREIVAAERHGAILQQRLCSLDPRITSVLEFGDQGEYFYILMEYVDGQDLSELAATQRLGYPFAARIAQDVLEVLGHVHGFRTTIEGREYRGIVHGDIKPRNIRLTTVGQVKVLDFGIAKALSLTRQYTQNQFGSVQYSSPERLNTGEVTADSDLWSVAVVLYELVAGRPYFQAENGARLEHLIRNYHDLRLCPDQCPDELKRILARALSPHLEERYRTAAEFAAGLAAFRSGAPALAPPVDEATRRTTPLPDEGETRRTSVAADTDPTADAEQTRRTVREAEPPSPPPKPAAVPHIPGRAPRVPLRPRATPARIFIALMLLVGLWLGFLAMNEYRVWQDSKELARDLETERLVSVDKAWERYRSLAARANLKVSLWSAQDALRQRLMSGVDRIMYEFRVSDAPSVSETEWLAARQNTAHALELMPRDKAIRGRLRLIDGHIERIRGTARRDTRLLESSRASFTEAAGLLGKSPDPWLGLARLYVYGLRDVDKAEDALREAQDHDFEMGRRETAMLADGYRERAERNLREAERASGGPEVERLLELAEKDFKRARERYESVIPFGGATAALRKCYEGLESVERRRAAREVEEQ
jgi:serine/threonine protein kinase